MSIAVDQPFDAPPFSHDGCRYEYVDGHHLFIVALAEPASDEIDLFQNSKVKLGFIHEPGAILFVIKFHAKFQQTSSLNWHLLPADTSLPEDPKEPGQAALATLVLLDRQLNVVKAIRAATLTSRFTKSLHPAIRKHAASPSNRAAYDQAVARLDESFDRLWSCVDDACLLGGVSG